MDHERHRDRSAIVTGAASGIGRATALRLTGEGARVVAIDIDKAGLEETVATIERGGGTITPVVYDLTEPGAPEAAVRAAAELGGIDILANVAGIMDFFLPVDEVDDETWDRVIAVNLTAIMTMCRKVIPVMRAAGHGSIVNVSSVAGIMGSGAGAAYHASKHGVIGLTRHVAFMYAPFGIRSNAVCPGGTATNIGTTAAPRVPWAYERFEKALTLAERTADPDEIASVISFLASDEAANVNGAVVTADAGWTVA